MFASIYRPKNKSIRCIMQPNLGLLRLITNWLLNLPPGIIKEPGEEIWWYDYRPRQEAGHIDPCRKKVRLSSGGQAWESYSGSRQRQNNRPRKRL